MILNYRDKYQLRIDCRISIKRIAVRHGVCSQIFGTDNHILLWDFDDISLKKVIHSMSTMQTRYKLPDIYILQSSNGSYHAQCYCSYDFKKIIHILSDTQYIDMDYLQLGIARGYFTLRYTPKSDNVKLKMIHILKSDVISDITPFDVTINEYTTSNL